MGVGQYVFLVFNVAYEMNFRGDRQMKCHFT